MTNKQITEQKYQCPYQGECGIYHCNPEQSCYTRQILYERNQAEARVKELEEKLKIAKEVLQYLDNTKTLNDLYLKYRVQQALQKIKEVDNE